MTEHVIHLSGCVLCGSELAYAPTSTDLVCAICGQTFEANVRCANGHYVCDACHALSATDVIESFCGSTEMEDPTEIALTLMQHASVKMHGPEHHFLVPAVLLAAWANLTGNRDRLSGLLREARSRAERVRGGMCGSHGACGAGIGVGLFVSLVTSATPLSVGPWKLGNLATAHSLLRIADVGGPRCCKRCSLLAIQEAVRFTQEQLGVALRTRTPPPCTFSSRNKQCIGEQCPFDAGGAS